MSHGDTGSAVQGLWDEHTASAFPPRLRGREVGGVEMVLLDADVAGCVESWLGSPQPLSGQRRERLEQCRAELDHVLPLLKRSGRKAYGTLFGRLALRVGNGLDPLADLLR